MSYSLDSSNGILWGTSITRVIQEDARSLDYSSHALFLSHIASSHASRGLGPKLSITFPPSGQSSKHPSPKIFRGPALIKR